MRRCIFFKNSQFIDSSICRNIAFMTRTQKPAGFGTGSERAMLKKPTQWASNNDDYFHFYSPLPSFRERDEHDAQRGIEHDAAAFVRGPRVFAPLRRRSSALGPGLRQFKLRLRSPQRPFPAQTQLPGETSHLGFAGEIGGNRSGNGSGSDIRRSSGRSGVGSGGSGSECGDSGAL